MEVQPRPKSKRKAKPSTDRRAALVLWGKIIHLGDFYDGLGVYPLCVGLGVLPGSCEGPLQAAHIVRRTRSATATDLNNGRLLCLRHHTLVDDDPTAMLDLVGEAELRRLHDKARAGTRASGMTPTMFWRAERQRLAAIWEAMS